MIQLLLCHQIYILNKKQIRVEFIRNCQQHMVLYEPGLLE